jgi:hypothetical protein
VGRRENISASVPPLADRLDRVVGFPVRAEEQMLKTLKARKTR